MCAGENEPAVGARASERRRFSSDRLGGASGAAEPNALITYGETGETGVSIGRGKSSATGGIIPGGESQCTGEATVTATLVTGAYTCKGITSYEPGKGMGTVDITVRFTAKS